MLYEVADHGLVTYYFDFRQEHSDWFLSVTTVGRNPTTSWHVGRNQEEAARSFWSCSLGQMVLARNCRYREKTDSLPLFADPKEVTALLIVAAEKIMRYLWDPKIKAPRNVHKLQMLLQRVNYVCGSSHIKN